ncbi:MAG: M42 family metallopeptidase [Planctomycetota bacterium]|nr:M42 family metallopeptidase [Planctomycetota bacterium]
MDNPIMDENAKDFLKRLLETPGVSGYEQSVQQVVADYASSFADSMEKDLHGNLILKKNETAATRVLYAGHCDQIGLLVSQIDDNGFLYFQTVGGWDAQQLIGQRVSVWTDQGEIPGVIAKKAIHLQDDSERKQASKAKDLWVDIGATDKEDAQSVVRIGDSITLRLGFQELRNGRANAPAMDDRTGLWVCVEGMRRAGNDLNCALFVASTVQEEIGLRGARTAAYNVDPHVGIAVDVTHATDCPTIDKRQQGEINLGGGPVIFRGPNMNPRVVERLLSECESSETPYQLSALGRAAPNDSNSLQVSRGGVASGLVAVPNRYMHSGVETISLADIDHAANLLASFARSVQPEDTFVP